MAINEGNMPVAKNADEIIQSKGLKRTAVARKAGYTDQALTDMLRGRKVIKAHDVLRISRALEVTPNDLFGIADAQPPTGGATEKAG